MGIIGPGGSAGVQSVVTTPEEYGAARNNVKDDTEAIRKAINEAVAKGIANKSYYAEVHFTAGTYLVGGAPVQGGATKGNAQIPLPVMSETGPGFTLVLKGIEDASPINFFLTESTERRTACLNSTLIGVFSGEFGAPSVIGGPTPQGFAAGKFNNMLIVVQGITVQCVKNPNCIAYDFRKMSEVNIPNAAALVKALPSELSVSLPTNELGIGLYTPLANNGNNCNIGTFTAEGYYYGVAFSDHFNADRLLTVYTHAGAHVTEPGLFSQGAVIKYFSLVASVRGIECEETEGSIFPLNIEFLQIEEVTEGYITDKKNVLVGNVFMNEGEHGNSPKLLEAKKLRVIDLNKIPGKAAATPTAGELEAGITNPYYRDAVFTIVNGETIEVDGAAQIIPAVGVAVPITVPSGKTLKVKKVVGKTIEVKAVLL